MPNSPTKLKVKRAWVEFLGEPPGAGEDRVDAISGPPR